MEVYQAGCQVLQKLKTGGTQRVVVQHQQLLVSPHGPAVVVNNHRSKKRGSGYKGEAERNER